VLLYLLFGSFAPTVIVAWLVGVLWLIGVALAMRNPSRGQHDRLAGTWLVPR